MRTLILCFCLTIPLFAQEAKPPFYADKANLLVYVERDGKTAPVKTLDDWKQRRAHIVANMQRVMGPLPADSKKVPLEMKVEAEETLGQVVRQKITFAVEKDDRLTAYLLLPKVSKGKLPAMLCLHQTTNIGKGEPAGVGGLKNLHYALELAERGIVTLAPDYPNFGDYKLDVYAKGYVSATMKGIWNHLRAVAVLTECRWRQDWLHRPFARWAQFVVRGGLRSPLESHRDQLRVQLVCEVLQR
jgi:hypothetical protein